MAKHQVEHFGLRRKIVANMTTESWETIPHAGSNYEPDVTDFWETYQALRKNDPRWAGVTFNTLMLYVITQGLIACPAMNGHIHFRRESANGRLEQREAIDISMPMNLPEGGMMTINMHGCEAKSLRQMADAMEDIRRRMANTNLEYAMYEAALENTLRLLRQGKVYRIARRLYGNTVGKGKMVRLKGQAKREYLAIPETERLTKRDIEQGSITVSNLGSVYRGGAYAPPVMLEIIPPQVCVIGIGALAERPGVVVTGDKTKAIAPRQFLPVSLMFDHRALDYADLVPFMRRLDEIFAEPSVMQGW
ncbi:MAG: 2-oxo acid dehydrogenase subunit E2 [Oscillospiraceae bacterium]|jgi:pyruvate dehydrogenase E2 component (dihydrolipoamide acetyltransferase)|nr:2-oxo acid dehydrogenase subunit E2 [Oscillospiraceae bacterium]